MRAGHAWCAKPSAGLQTDGGAPDRVGPPKRFDPRGTSSASCDELFKLCATARKIVFKMFAGQQPACRHGVQGRFKKSLNPAPFFVGSLASSRSLNARVHASNLFN